MASKIIKAIDLGFFIFLGCLIVGGLFTLFIYNDIQLSEKNKIEQIKEREVFFIKMKELGIDSIRFVTKENEYIQSYRSGIFWALVDKVFVNGIESNVSYLFNTTSYFLSLKSKNYYIYIVLSLDPNHPIKQQLSIILTFTPEVKYEVFDIYGNLVDFDKRIPIAFISNDFRNQRIKKDNFKNPPNWYEYR